MANEPKYLAVRCFRSEAAMATGRRGRRLVIDTADGGVTSLATNEAGEATGMRPDNVAKGVDPSTITSVDELTLALANGRTPVVLLDQALTDFVNENDGQLPAEGLYTTDAVPNTFVDKRPEAVRRRERIAQAPKETPIPAKA